MELLLNCERAYNNFLVRDRSSVQHLPEFCTFFYGVTIKEQPCA